MINRFFAPLARAFLRVCRAKISQLTIQFVDSYVTDITCWLGLEFFHRTKALYEDLVMPCQTI